MPRPGSDSERRERVTRKRGRYRYQLHFAGGHTREGRRKIGWHARVAKDSRVLAPPSTIEGMENRKMSHEEDPR